MSIITLSCGSQGKKQQTEFEQIIPEAEKIVSLSRNQNPKLMTVRRVILCLRRKGFYASCTAFSPYFVYERWRCNRQGFVANLWLLNAGAHGARRGDGVGLRTTGRLALAFAVAWSPGIRCSYFCYPLIDKRGCRVYPISLA